MHLYVGTSGFAYKEWKGTFYPADLGEDQRLSWYAGRFNAVEIDSTFYRFPTAAGLAAWAAQVPETFRFAIKVPRRITHIKRLRAVDEDLGYLIETVGTLGRRLGPLLFQLAPRHSPDPEALEDLLAQLPPRLHAAFEFRHPGWFSDDILRLLQRNGCALCFNDETMTEPQSTTDWGYLRLRRGEYSEAEIAASAEGVLRQDWKAAYVFLKHESADAPRLAQQWLLTASMAAPLRN